MKTSHVFSATYVTKIFTKMLKEIFFLFMMICGCLSSEAPTVVTNSGKIVGHYLISLKGNMYNAYQGIPYALPPVGERRFQSPIPVPPWSGELLANRLKSSCWQHGRVPLLSNGGFTVGDEDCLYLNVFVPRRTANTTLPVSFWIHGGGFQYGRSEHAEETYLMDYLGILVTVQYRLGALGFLSTEDEVVSGNMGLKDQSLALKWVHDNIQYFRGDPNKITLYGHSAGGASVHYHYLSPMSAGLFQNGISFSGTAFNDWAQVKNSRQMALKLGNFMNCTANSTEEMVRCLRERPAHDLVKAQNKFRLWRSNPSIPFGPVVEKFTKGSFIDRSPHEIMKSGNIYDAPWITGVVSEDGLYSAIEYVDDVILKEINDDWDRVAPFLLGFYDTIPNENHTRLAQTIRKHYFSDKTINKDTFINLVYLLTDRWYIVDAENAARAQAKANKSPVFFYYYNHRTVDSMSSELSNFTNNFGVAHGDDVYLIIRDALLSPTKSPKDIEMQKALIKIFISFATNKSKPDLNVEWSQVDSRNGFQYLKISGPENEEFKMTATDNLGQRKFWNSIDLK